MTIEYGPRGLIGVLTPQANTTVEPEFSILMPPGFAMINARLVSSQTTMEARLVDYFANYEQACTQFSNAPLSALAFGCTGASYLAGRDQEAKTIALLEARFGVPAFTAANAVVDALKSLGAKRIGLCSPYPDGLHEQSVHYWKSHGFEVRADSRIRSDPTAFHPIYAMTTKVVANSLLDLQTLPLDAIVMLGTGMPSLELVLAANRTGNSTPVLSCMLCLAWYVFSRINQDTADLASWLLGQHWRSAFEARRSVVV